MRAVTRTTASMHARDDGGVRAGTGGNSAGLAYEILQPSFQLDIPRMFAALLLITVTGVGLFGLMVWLQQIVLGGWHETAVKREN